VKPTGPTRPTLRRVEELARLGRRLTRARVDSEPSEVCADERHRSKRHFIEDAEGTRIDIVLEGGIYLRYGRPQYKCPATGESVVRDVRRGEDRISPM